MSRYNTYADLASVPKGTKILFANFPGDGHFSPLTGLAVHLKSIGCDVRWYTSATYSYKVEKLGIPFYPFRKAFDIAAAPDIDAAFPDRKKKKGVAKLRFDLEHVFIRRSTEYYDDIRDLYEEFPFQVMVADICFGAIPFVKEKMNIPVVSIGVVPLPETSKDLPPYGLGLTPSSTFAGKAKQALLRLLSEKVIFARPTRIMANILRSYDIDPGKANIFDLLIQKSTIVLQSGTPGFEYTRTDKSPHIHFAGPLLPYAAPSSNRKPWYDAKLDRYSKKILVTQGTVEKDVSKILIPALEAFRDSDCLLIVTTGGSQTEELRNRYSADNIIIEDFIPFDDVMPLVDVYISNGGYGGVLMAIGHGLPMVVAGIHEGKNEINARVGYFKLGVNLRTERPSVLQLRKATEAVLQDHSFSKNVADLREEFSAYDPALICTHYLSSLLPLPAVRKRQSLEVIY